MRIRIQFTFVLFLVACNFKQQDVLNGDQWAIEENNEALRIYSRNFSNKDSLQRALVLYDSALLYRKDKIFYNNKYIAARRLGRYALALSCCDSILVLDHDNFFATLHKGYIFEDMSYTDSQNLYYTKAYDLVDNWKSSNGGDMMKDRERIILKGLLKDSVAYMKMVHAFAVKYDSSQIAKGIASEFMPFNREQFLEKF